MADIFTNIEDSSGNIHDTPWVRGDAAGTVTITLTSDDDWPASAESNTWEMWVDEHSAGGTPDVKITADSASIQAGDSTKLDVTFSPTADETESIGGTGEIWADADIKEETGSGIYTTRAHGKVHVVDSPGGG